MRIPVIEYLSDFVHLGTVFELITGLVIATNASKKLVGSVALIVRPGVGLSPAPIMASIPESVIASELARPSQLSLSRVRGSASAKVATENMSRRRIEQRPLLDRTDRANCPESNSEPCPDLVCAFDMWHSQLADRAAYREDNRPQGQNFTSHRTPQNISGITPVSPGSANLRSHKTTRC